MLFRSVFKNINNPLSTTPTRGDFYYAYVIIKTYQLFERIEHESDQFQTSSKPYHLLFNAVIIGHCAWLGDD